MPATYIEVAIRTQEETRDQLVALLGQLGFEGFWEDVDTLRGYLREQRWSASMQAGVDDVIRTVHRSSRSSLPDIIVTRIPDVDWNAAWEKTIRPIRIGRRIVIAPTWHPHTPEPGDVVITIDPKMSFGTGYHESTRLIIRLMEDSVRAGSAVLDIGTGTGVLAIGAVKLGAGSAVGVDVDEWSEMNARENAELNGVSTRVTIIRGTLADVPEATFDVVLANIQRTILLPIMRDMIARLRPSGTLLLSGLLLGDEEDIVHAAESAGATVVDRESENEWIALALRVAPHQDPR
jgi:ribosomal protein L11 methyltransferase